MNGKQNAPAGEGEGVVNAGCLGASRAVHTAGFGLWGSWLFATHGDGGQGGRRREDDGFGGADGFGIGGGDRASFDGDIDGEVDELAQALVLLGRFTGDDGRGGEDEEGELHGDRCDCWST